MLTKDQIDAFFAEYERSFSALDMGKTGELYADTFIGAGPKGTITQSKTQFVEWGKKAAEFYRQAGQTGVKIINKQEQPITNEYTMVTVHWGATFEKTGDEITEFDVTYIIQETSAQPQIIMFITHQDEQEAMKKLGVMEEAHA
jgi:hypothetical protein